MSMRFAASPKLNDECDCGTSCDRLFFDVGFVVISLSDFE